MTFPGSVREIVKCRCELFFLGAEEWVVFRNNLPQSGEEDVKLGACKELGQDALPFHAVEIHFEKILRVGRFL